MFGNRNNNLGVNSLDPRVNNKIFEDLWKERRLQKIWIWAFFAVIIAVFAISAGITIARFVQLYTPTDTTSFYYESFSSWVRAHATTGASEQAILDSIAGFASRYQSTLIFSAFVIGSLIILIWSFLHSYSNAVSKKTFHLLSRFASTGINFALAFLTFTTIYTLSQLTFGIYTQNQQLYVLELIQIIVYPILLVISIVVSRMYRQVIMTYWRVYFTELQKIHAEEIRKSILNGDLSAFDPFGFAAGAGASMNQHQDPYRANARTSNRFEEDADSLVTEVKEDGETVKPNKGKQFAPELSKEEKDYQTVFNLKIEQIHKMAEKLDIYGYKEMSKEELVRKIIALSSEKNNK
ncbi:hypothetical protein [Mycoplasmopsis agassizii]|uniref:Rho termination factor N-terminal domain-containing protein n=1 Tax=Mycoplasmopsis agassizii TaxID=33922 RepID=A0ABX4H6S2_9BACT|nr:hypothetical protein [Mycoplasmopsis agassizii]PAF55547.1 hypothetical protein CJF60_02635 [Mycoplasmopsis agassizii]SMC17882.1 hypothetical protein SAMN02745179_00542 [Mycoplasmopsis agassizii]